MKAMVAEEADETRPDRSFFSSPRSDRVAPFGGPFSAPVWGIMNIFFQIGAQPERQPRRLVAPGIAEGAVCPALGLFAAIPAVIAYNRFFRRGERLRGQAATLRRQGPSGLSRELDRL